MDWQNGDLALCVDTSDRVVPGIGVGTAGERLRKGAIYEVTGIGNHPLVGETILWLKGHELSAAAARFRKIAPHQPDEEDQTTIDLLNSVPETAEERDAELETWIDTMADAGAFGGRT